MKNKDNFNFLTECQNWYSKRSQQLTKGLLLLALFLMGFVSQAQDPAQYGTPFNGVPYRMDANIYQLNFRQYTSAGTIVAAKNNLQRLKDLGINVVYVMPFAVVTTDATKGQSKSPYSVKDLKNVDPGLGTLQDIRDFVAQCHTLGMATIFDFVPNQTAWDHPWVTQHNDWYAKNPDGTIRSPDAGAPGSPFLFTDVAEINLGVTAASDAMISAIRYWIFAANFDGVRLDWADKAGQAFNTNLVNNLRSITSHNLLLLAEGSNEGTTSNCLTCGDNQPGKHWEQGWDYIYGTSFTWNVMKKVWKDGEPATNFNGVTTGEYLGASDTQMAARMVTSHDIYDQNGSPYTWIPGGRNAVLGAFALSALHRGVPFIYNGVEVGNTNPLPYPWRDEKINWTQDLTVYTEMQKILNFRNGSTVIKRGQPTSYVTSANNNVIAFAKVNGAEKVVMMVNVRGGSQTFTIPAGMAGSYVNPFNNNAAVTLTSGQSVTLNAYQYLVYTNANVPIVAVTGVTASPTSASIKVGLKTQLSASIAPSNATNQNVTWTSSNTGVATVDANGLVTGIAAGTATITVTTQDGNKTSSSAITVTPASTFTVHFYKPAAWGTGINIYWWSALPAGVLADGSWPGVSMTNEGSNWYAYTFTNVTSTNLIFNAGNDTDKTVDLNRGTTGWYQNGTWYNSNPGVVNSLTISPTSQSYTSAASSQTVTVTSNVSWTVSDNQSWITTSATSGSNNGSFSVTVTANTGAARTGIVTVTGGGITQTVAISQSAASAATAIPGIIQAESWTNMSGVQTESTTDTGGGLNVGWIDAGDWLDYNVNVASAGSYVVSFRMASGASGGTLQLRNSGGTVLGSAVVGGTGGWQNWTTINLSASLTAGTQTIRLHALTGGYNVNWVQFATSASSLTLSTASQSFGNTASSQTVNVTSNVGWTVSDDQSWISTSATSGSNNGSFSVSVTANTGAARSGIVTVVGGGITRTVAVSQSAASTGGGTYYSIQNRWTNAYLYDAGANVGYGSSVANNNYKWEKVAVDGTYFLLKNLGTGEYAHIENQTGSVQCTTADVGWWSAQWSQDNIDGTWIRIRNRWQTGNIIHVENQTGSAQYANSQDGWYSAQWKLQTVTGSRLGDSGLGNNAASGDLNVYPNPIQNELRFELSTVANEKVSFSLIDAAGRVHFQESQISIDGGQLEHKINTSQLKSGLYIFKVESASGIRVQRIVKN